MECGGGGGWNLSMMDSAHEEGDIPLDIYVEFLHGHEELGSGVYVDGAISLKVQELGADECVVFVTCGSTVAEPTCSVLSGDIRVAA